MKKLIKRLILLIACFAIIIASAFTANAAKISWSPKIAVDSITAARGDTVYVNVVVSESTHGIMALTFSLLYDNSALTYVNFKKGIYYDTPFVVDHGRYISVVICENGSNFRNGNIITLEFKVKDDAYSGSYPIKVANIRPDEKGESLKGCFANWRGDTITPIVANGVLNIPLTQENCKHSFSPWEIKTEATCTEKGLQNRFCSVCGKNQNEEIELKEHEFNDFWTIDRPATETEEGVMSRHCKNCDEKKDYVTFKKEVSEENSFGNEEDQEVTIKDWQELEDYKTSDGEEEPTVNQKPPVEVEPEVTEPQEEKPEEIPMGAEDLIDRSEEKLGIAGIIYRYLYGTDGNGGIIGAIVKAFKEFLATK